MIVPIVDRPSINYITAPAYLFVQSSKGRRSCRVTQLNTSNPETTACATIRPKLKGSQGDPFEGTQAVVQGWLKDNPCKSHKKRSHNRQAPDECNHDEHLPEELHKVILLIVPRTIRPMTVHKNSFG